MACSWISLKKFFVLLLLCLEILGGQEYSLPKTEEPANITASQFNELRTESTWPGFIINHGFPAADFFNISKDKVNEFDQMNMRYYFQHFLSRMVCSGDSCLKTCSCDPSCMEFRTCCIDYLWNTQNPTPIEDYLRLFVHRSKQYPQLDCRPIMNHFENHLVETVSMIAVCPKATDDDLYALCSSSGTTNDVNVPVLGSDGYIYRNQYCALCNSIAQYKHVNISIDCKEADDVTFPGKFLSNFHSCEIAIVTPEDFPNAVQKCYNVYTRSCDRYNPLYDLCNAYLGEVGNYPEYANVHCLWCNGKTLDIYDSFACKKTRIRIVERSYSFVISFVDGTELSYRNARIPDFNPDGTMSTLAGSRNICPSGQVFDISEGVCVPFACASGYLLKGSVCRRESPTPSTKVIWTADTLFDCHLHRGVYLYFLIASARESEEMASSLQFYLQGLFNYSLSLTLLRNVSHHYVSLSHPIAKGDLDKVLTLFSQSDNDIWNWVDILLFSSENVLHFTDLYGADFARHISDNICAEPVPFNDSQAQSGTNCEVIWRDYNSSYDHVEKSSFLITVRPGVIFKQVFVCKKFHLSSACPLSVVPLTNVMFINSSAFVHARNKTFTSSEYTPLAFGIGICIGTQERKARLSLEWLQSAYKIEYYLTMIGIPISMMSYLWIILTYLLIRELRNIAGLNLVALCASLLSSDFIFLTVAHGNHRDSACKGLAIVLHWFLLLVQIWTGINAFEILRKFASSVRHSGGYLKRFCVYCFVSLFLSSSIVAVMVAVDETSGLVGYGRKGICWITYFKARFFGYIFIVILSTAASTMFLAFVIMKIYMQKKDVRIILKGSQVKEISVVKISLKLVLLVGFVEIVGLIQLTSPISEWEYAFNTCFRIMYTALRSCRGILIWLMYIAAKPIFQHYVRKIENTSFTLKLTTTSRLEPSVNASQCKLNSISDSATPDTARVESQLQ